MGENTDQILGCKGSLWSKTIGILMKIVALKYQLEAKTRMRWPAYALHQEGLKLKKPNWNEKYSRDQRIVMWDMANIEAFFSVMPTFKDLPTANIINKIASKVVFLFSSLVGLELESYGQEL